MTESRIAAGIPAAMADGLAEVMGEMADRLPLGGMGAGSVEETAETENSCGTLAIPE